MDYTDGEDLGMALVVPSYFLFSFVFFFALAGRRAKDISSPRAGADSRQPKSRPAASSLPPQQQQKKSGRGDGAMRGWPVPQKRVGRRIAAAAVDVPPGPTHN
ncbi:unnamed protein product [Caenorhabditis auriculariae]|uniref:Uncharacterized protein n=1 Tax=Caenorhabditis auriculariae TaxID=2777116 RepID=A0A8S1HB17_9PELO|nr:unnamed protein product [Caenorhabditis auriculariae]